MHTFCSHIGLLAAGRAVFSDVFMTRPSHHGENAHHMEELPERRGPAADKLQGLSKGSSGGRPTAEVKRAMHPDYAKREEKKNRDRTQAKATQTR